MITTFEDLRRRWEELGFPENAAAKDPATARELRDPAERRFLLLCVNWLRYDRKTELPNSALINAWFPTKELHFAAQCHLAILGSLCEDNMPQPHQSEEVYSKLVERSDSRGNTTTVLGERVADVVRLGQFEELYYEMSALTSDAAKTEIDGKLCCGPMRPADHDATAPLLLVDSKGAILASLTVEAIKGGRGDIWAAPALMLHPMDHGWRQTPEIVKAFFLARGVWPSDYDFRYKISLAGDANWQASLKGDSWFGPLQMLILCLLYALKPKRLCREFALPRLLTTTILPYHAKSTHTVRRAFQRLLSFPAHGVATTASPAAYNEAISENQANQAAKNPLEWAPVADSLRKLLVAVKETVPSIKTVIMANRQPFDSLIYSRPHPERKIWNDPNGAYRLIKAECLEEALRLVHYTKRWRRRLILWGGSALLMLAILAIGEFFRPPVPLSVDELITSIQAEEFQRPGTNSILVGVQKWTSNHGYTLKGGLARVRKYCEEFATAPSKEVRSIFLWNKLGPIASWPARTTNDWVVKVNDMLLLRVEPGSYWMGTAASDKEGQRQEMPAKHVAITRPFWIGKYKVTQAEFEAVRHYNPSFFNGVRRMAEVGDVDFGEELTRPVENLSWHDAVVFCEALSQGERRKIDAVIGTNYVFRLPTEAEWEYVCRAGMTNRYGFADTPESLDRYAWRGQRNTRSVGLKLPNPWGLYDMLGNVNELCIDNYKETGFAVSATNPVCTFSNEFRLARGASFLDITPSRFRCAYRHKWPESSSGYSYGFRVVLAPRIELLDHHE